MIQIKKLNIQDKSVFIDSMLKGILNMMITDKHILPSLGISQKQTKKVKHWIDTINRIYDNSHRDFDLFCENIDKEISDRNNHYRGF